MASAIEDPSYNNWVKASEGMHECALLAAKIVESTMDNWHKSVAAGKETELQCAGDPTCKPKLKDNNSYNRPSTDKGY